MDLSLEVARKVPIFIGLAMILFMLGANHTDSSYLVIVFVPTAFCGSNFASITWSLVFALALERLLGLTGGLFNLIGNLSSIAAPIVIGTLATDIDFAPAFIYMAVVTIVGVQSYVFFVGKVERVEEQVLRAVLHARIDFARFDPGRPTGRQLLLHF